MATRRVHLGRVGLMLPARGRLLASTVGSTQAPVPLGVEQTNAMLMGESGFTLAELLVSIAILICALLGVATTVAVQSGGVSASMGVGQAAIVRGYYVSTATTLAQERLEQAKRLQYTLGPPVVDQVGAPIPPGFEDEAYGTIAGHHNFSRQVRVQSETPGANLKTVTVRVIFRLPTERRLQEESIVLGTIIAARP